MKTARRYLARTVFVVVWVAFLPVAVVMLSSLWMIDSLVIPTLDDLEAIARDK